MSPFQVFPKMGEVGISPPVLLHPCENSKVHLAEGSKCLHLVQEASQSSDQLWPPDSIVLEWKSQVVLVLISECVSLVGRK